MARQPSSSRPSEQESPEVYQHLALNTVEHAYEEAVSRYFDVSDVLVEKRVLAFPSPVYDRKRERLVPHLPSPLGARNQRRHALNEIAPRTYGLTVAVPW